MLIHKNNRNPLLPLEYHFPDCEAHVMSNGKLYLYGSYDREAGVYCSDQYHVVSTGDMVHWTVHDVSFRAQQAEWASGEGVKTSTSFDQVQSYDDLPKHIKDALPPEALQMPFEQLVAALKANIETQTEKVRARGPILYAPDAIEYKGKYYLYMCLSDDSEGVAVSDRPEGPFEAAKRLPVTGIDPAVFVDDDGQAYYYWGQFSASVASLKSGMMSLDEDSIVTGIVTEKEHHFHEGSSMRKRGDTYYYVLPIRAGENLPPLVTQPENHPGGLLPTGELLSITRAAIQKHGIIMGLSKNLTGSGTSSITGAHATVTV